MKYVVQELVMIKGQEMPIEGQIIEILSSFNDDGTTGTGVFHLTVLVERL